MGGTDSQSLETKFGTCVFQPGEIAKCCRKLGLQMLTNNQSSMLLESKKVDLHFKYTCKMKGGGVEFQSTTPCLPTADTISGN